MYQLPIKMDSIGRILIPAIIRNQLDYTPDTEYMLIVEEGVIKIIPTFLLSAEATK